MFLCEAAPLILFQFGDIAITTRSIPSALAVPLYVLGCLTLCIRRRTLGWIDPAIILSVTALQLLIIKTSSVGDGAAGLAGPAMLAPFMLFMAGYAVWRLAARKPLERWPWPRFGLVVTMTMLLSDIGIALLTPAAPGKVWQLGGGCMNDALLVGPPFAMMVFYGLLDCRSSWVFCSRKCRDLGYCRFGMDGKSCGGDCQC